MLIEEKIKNFETEIIILDKDELPLKSITGQVLSGSLSINGDAPIRRAGSLSIILDAQDEIDYENLKSDFSINKKIKIIQTITAGNIEQKYPLGIFVITAPNFSNSINGLIVNLSFQDKMCLLNGECGGTLPASVIFDTYDYRDKDSVISMKNRIYDIIYTLVVNYGNEDPSRVFIDNIPLRSKQIVRYTGSEILYYNKDTSQYLFNIDSIENKDACIAFKYNDECGYEYTDFVYPGELISGFGDSVCSILDTICTTLGNYEYFYDINGDFHFQEIQNYLNKSYLPVTALHNEIGLDGSINVAPANSNMIELLDNISYKISNYIDTSVYSFNKNNGLVNTYNNVPVYTNIKNDFHVWGQNKDGRILHYHLAIKDKPILTSFNVIAGENDLIIDDEKGVPYTPFDWRIQLYLTALQKKNSQFTTIVRPDIYEQEVFDYFNSMFIYDKNDPQYYKYKDKLNNLDYWIDFLEPDSTLSNIKIDDKILNNRICVYQQDKINRLYNSDIPNIIILDNSLEEEVKKEQLQECYNRGDKVAFVNHAVYSNLSIGAYGYTAQEAMRNLLYQHTNYISSINISSIPIYDLDVNTRINVQDERTNIYGDYIVKTISIPLNAAGFMSISASKVFERV